MKAKHSVTPVATDDTQFAEGRAAGVKSERERIAAILGCEEAKDRPGLALNVACHTDLDVEAAKLLLAASGKGPHTKINLFADAMARLGNPVVGIDGILPTAPQTDTNAAAIYARRAEEAKRLQAERSV